MSTTLVNVIRKLGCPDLHGRIQYGNAAILCYLSSHNNRAIEFVERFKDVRINELISQHS